MIRNMNHRKNVISNECERSLPCYGNKISPFGRNDSIVCHSERTRGISLYVKNQLMPLLFGQIRSRRRIISISRGRVKADRRAQSARPPRGTSLANSLREAKGGACPPFLRSYDASPVLYSPSLAGILPSVAGILSFSTGAGRAARVLSNSLKALSMRK